MRALCAGRRRRKVALKCNRLLSLELPLYVFTLLSCFLKLFCGKLFLHFRNRDLQSLYSFRASAHRPSTSHHVSVVRLNLKLILLPTTNYINLKMQRAETNFPCHSARFGLLTLCDSSDTFTMSLTTCIIP